MRKIGMLAASLLFCLPAFAADPKATLTPPAERKACLTKEQLKALIESEISAASARNSAASSQVAERLAADAYQQISTAFAPPAADPLPALKEAPSTEPPADPTK